MGLNMELFGSSYGMRSITPPLITALAALVVATQCLGDASAGKPGADGKSLSQSTGASNIFLGFDSGSLGYSLETNLFAHTNASLSTNAEFLFSVMDYSRTNFVRNPGFWLGQPPQLAATVVGAWGTNGGPGSTLSGYIGGAAVSPVHVINCRHAPFVAGNVLLFIDSKGIPVIRTVLGNVGLYADINVGLLNRPLPPTIHPFALLPPDMTNYLPADGYSYAYNFVAQNKFQKIFPVKIGWSGDTNADAWVFSCFPDTTHFPADWGWTPIAGDSGHPIMTLVGTNLLLVGHWTSPQSGPLYNAYYSNIDSAMHRLSTNFNIGSDYQLSTGDLSGFTYYGH